jgi:RNA polymerase sigma-70 factor (ECF subfamily)
MMAPARMSTAARPLSNEPTRESRRADRAEEVRRLARARAGDRDAFDRLAVSAMPSLLGTARRLLPDALSAEEAVAEALYRAYRHLTGFRGDGRFSTWVHGILCRVAADRYRAWARDARRVEQAAARLESPHCPSPLDALGARETEHRLRAAVERLPPNQRLVLLLVTWEGLGLAEAGRVLGMRYATAKSNLHHARRALRGLVDEETPR